MAASVTEDQVRFYQENGFVHIPDFLTPDEVRLLKQDIKHVIDASVIPPVVKPHIQMMGTKYHLDSVATADLFFEKECVSPDGKLTAEPHLAVHKIAHAVHVMCPGAKAVTFSQKMTGTIHQLTGFKRPVLVQGMFLLKQAHYGEASPVHADETYVMSEPQGFVTGVWIALDDSLEHNGCLQFLPRSQTTHRLTKKWIRKRVDGHEAGHESESLMKFVDEDPEQTASQIVREEDFVPVPVKSGGLVLINGLVLHKSSPNTSDDPRSAYTFHFCEQHDQKVRWSPLNWAQETPDYKFPELYSRP